MSTRHNLTTKTRLALLEEDINFVKKMMWFLILLEVGTQAVPIIQTFI